MHIARSPLDHCAAKVGQLECEERNVVAMVSVAESIASDAEAMRRCQQGDMGGLAELVARYQLAAVRAAYLLVQDRALAEDIVQDSFLLAYRASKQFRPGAPFAPWFYRIVLNAARQQQRTTRRRHEVSLDQAFAVDREAHDSSVAYATTVADPSEHAEHAEERDALLRALSLVPLKQREALVLRYYAGYRDKELATILDCPPGTVRWRLHAGLQALERAIQDNYPWLLRVESSPPGVVEHVEGEQRH